MQNRLRVLRAERNLTQAELAAMVNVTRQTIIAIESSKYDPSLSLAFAIARTFNQSIEDIFLESGSNTTRRGDRARVSSPEPRSTS